jgi:biotin carboxyl carrier protein
VLKITVNNKNEFNIEPSGETLLVNGKEMKPDLIKISDTRYHLILDHKSYRINILDQKSDKALVLEVNGNKYELDIKDRFDLLLHDLGMDAALSAKADFVKAPMPGLVINILVSEGETIAKDAPLIVLEAMKMENVLKAPAPGIVDKIKVKAKDAVEKGQVLITFK